MKTEHESTTQKQMKNIPYTVYTPYLTKDKSPVSEEEHHVKNEDEIDESHKSQLKFYYPRESFREGLCNHRSWFVCLSVSLLPR